MKNLKKTLWYSVIIASFISCQHDQKPMKNKPAKPQIATQKKAMQNQDFSTTLTVDQSPEKVFQAINNVRGWWSEEITGRTQQLNDVFDYHFQDVHRCKMKLITVVPNKKVVWLVLENYFKFTKDQTEWVGTKISFDLSEKNGKTVLVFTHQGLLPQQECYQICSDAWTNYIQNSLKDLIITGKGKPNGKEKPQTENEKKLAGKQ